jgi:hypothetical protein
MNGVLDNLNWDKFDLVGENGLFQWGHGTRLKVLDRTQGNTPLITAGSYNNGVKNLVFVDNNSNNKIYNNLT